VNAPGSVEPAQRPAPRQPTPTYDGTIGRAAPPPQPQPNPTEATRAASTNIEQSGTARPTLPQVKDASPWRTDNCVRGVCPYQRKIDLLLWNRRFHAVDKLFTWDTGFVIVHDTRCYECRNTAENFADSAAKTQNVTILQVGQSGAARTAGNATYQPVPFESPAAEELIHLGLGYEPCVVVVVKRRSVFAVCDRNYPDLLRSYQQMSRTAQLVAASWDPVTGGVKADFQGQLFPKMDAMLSGVLPFFAKGFLPDQPEAAPDKLYVTPAFVQALRTAYRPDREVRMTFQVAADGIDLKLASSASANLLDAGNCWQDTKDPEVCWPYYPLDGHTHPTSAVPFFSDGDIQGLVLTLRPRLLVTAQDVYLAVPTRGIFNKPYFESPNLLLKTLDTTCRNARARPEASYDQNFQSSVEEQAEELGVAIYKLKGTYFERQPLSGAGPHREQPAPTLEGLKDYQTAVLSTMSRLAMVSYEKADSAVAARTIAAVSDRRSLHAALVAKQNSSDVYEATKPMWDRIAANRVHINGRHAEAVSFHIGRGCEKLSMQGFEDEAGVKYALSYGLNPAGELIDQAPLRENLRR
jgi:hypothetical protein